MLKKNGFKYIENKKENIISFINDIEKIIDKNFDPKKNLNSLSFDNFNKLIFKTQNEINRKHHPINFAKRFPNIFKRELSSDKFYFQHYFYLRATRPANKVKGKQSINFHRETFQGPKWFKNIFNLWIPIKNCSINNSLEYYPKSHKFILNKDFSIEEIDLPIKKRSYSHKVGNLYREKKINFKKNISPKKLFKKGKTILFSGELIHGNVINKANKIRFSLDARLILQKNFKRHIIQGSNNKAYFKKVIL